MRSMTMLTAKKALVAVAVGSMALSAWAAGGGEGGHGHGRHGQGMYQGAGNPERAGAMSERMVERLARRVDATPEQREKLSAIAKAAAGEVAELRTQRGDLRKQSLDLLKAPTVDRTAIEALRSRQMSVMDAISKRMSAAMADAAEVLTPEQRVKLAERWESRRGGHRHGHRG